MVLPFGSISRLDTAGKTYHCAKQMYCIVLTGCALESGYLIIDGPLRRGLLVTSN